MQVRYSTVWYDGVVVWMCVWEVGAGIHKCFCVGKCEKLFDAILHPMEVDRFLAKPISMLISVRVFAHMIFKGRALE